MIRSGTLDRLRTRRRPPHHGLRRPRDHGRRDALSAGERPARRPCRLLASPSGAGSSSAGPSAASMRSRRCARPRLPGSQSTRNIVARGSARPSGTSSRRTSKGSEPVGSSSTVAPTRERRRSSPACGFRLEGTHTGLAVDPRTVVAPVSPPPGIVIATLGSFADDPQSVFEADYESFLDEPGPGDVSGMTYETWLRLIWDNPECDRELSTVAVADGVPVGISLPGLRPRDRHGAVNVGTGVIPAFRGRGLGLADEAGLADAGLPSRASRRVITPERRHEHPDGRHQSATRLQAVLNRAQLGARAVAHANDEASSGTRARPCRRAVPIAADSYDRAKSRIGLHVRPESGQKPHDS